MLSRQVFIFAVTLVACIHLSLCQKVLVTSMTNGDWPRYDAGLMSATMHGVNSTYHFLSKHSKDRDYFTWIVTFNACFVELVDLHVDNEGSSFVVGMCTAWAKDRSTMGLLDVCIYKFNPDAVLLSSKQFQYKEYDVQVKSVTLNADKNVMILTGLVTPISTQRTTQQIPVTIRWDMLASDFWKEEHPASTIGASR